MSVCFVCLSVRPVVCLNRQVKSERSRTIRPVRFPTVQSFSTVKCLIRRHTSTKNEYCSLNCFQSCLQPWICSFYTSYIPPTFHWNPPNVSFFQEFEKELAGEYKAIFANADGENSAAFTVSAGSEFLVPVNLIFFFSLLQTPPTSMTNLILCKETTAM